MVDSSDLKKSIASAKSHVVVFMVGGPLQSKESLVLHKDVRDRILRAELDLRFIGFYI